MATFQRFEDINAWKHGRALTREVYRVSRQGAFAKDYALRDQMRRAAISVTSNIAEDFERDSEKAFLHFLAVAKGSAEEVRSQLYVAFDEGYADRETFDRLCELAASTMRQIDELPART